MGFKYTQISEEVYDEIKNYDTAIDEKELYEQLNNNIFITK